MLKTEIDALPVMESFYTLQGEGYHTGTAAYFIRLGGCDVGCVWCDVKESWEVNAHPSLQISQLVNQATESGTKLTVITGGEPLMHNLDELTKQLKRAGLETNIETAGVHPLSGNWDWICFSPKKFKKPTEEIYKVANELKVIINHKSDFKFAEEHALKVNKGCRLYLQVEWSKKDKLSALLLDYIKENPKWKLSTQTHKYLDIP